VRLALLIAVLTLVSGCTDSLSNVEDYKDRLENVLNRKADDLNKEVQLTFPSAKDLAVQAPEFELSIREFLGMRTCQLHTVIAQRNSQLGKVATDSQRLFNDLEILSLGPACVDKLGESTLANKLSSFLTKKEAHLNTALWQALLASKEHKSFWHDKTFSENYPNDLGLTLDKELRVLSRFVTRVLSGERNVSQHQRDDVERALGQLRLGDGGHLLAEFNALARGLDQANTVIQKRLATPLCHSQQGTQQARYFSNVVNQYFIAKVQTQSVGLEQRAQALMPLINNIEKPLLRHATTAYKNWAHARDTQLRRGRAAMLNHVKLIQMLYQQCGLDAGIPKE